MSKFLLGWQMTAGLAAVAVGTLMADQICESTHGSPVVRNMLFAFLIAAAFFYYVCRTTLLIQVQLLETENLILQRDYDDLLAERAPILRLGDEEEEEFEELEIDDEPIYPLKDGVEEIFFEDEDGPIHTGIHIPENGDTPDIDRYSPGFERDVELLERAIHESGAVERLNTWHAQDPVNRVPYEPVEGPDGRPLPTQHDQITQGDMVLPPEALEQIFRVATDDNPDQLEQA